jgi:transposase
MNKIKLVAIDLAKRCYQVGAIDEQGKLMYNRKLSAAKFALAMQQLEPTVIAMEACAASHYWGRRLRAMGHQVRLIPPQHVKAFRRVHKSDAHDVVSIAEAAQRPNIHFVPVKTVAQQDLQLLGRVRERLVAQRTGTINQARGLAREYGVEFAKSRQKLLEQLPIALGDADNELSHIAREVLAELLAEIRQITEQLNSLMRRITEIASMDPAYERLRTIPGVGPTIAPAVLASLGHAQQFKNARSCAAWAGLVPKQHGTGGEVHLGGITKNGNRGLRVMLIHGARTVIQWAHKHDHAQSRWIKQLVARRGKNKAVVALANKLMRIVWIVLTQGVEFDMRKAFRAQPVSA